MLKACGNPVYSLWIEQGISCVRSSTGWYKRNINPNLHVYIHYLYTYFYPQHAHSNTQPIFINSNLLNSSLYPVSTAPTITTT